MKKTVTVPANNYMAIEIPAETDEGYIPAFTTGFMLNNLNLRVYNFYFDNDNCQGVISVKNTSSSDQTVNVVIHGVAEKTIFY